MSFEEFRLVDIDTYRLFELAEKNPMELFNAIRNILEECIKDIKDVRMYYMYFNIKTFEFLIKYIVRCDLGEISANLYLKIPEGL